MTTVGTGWRRAKREAGSAGPARPTLIRWASMLATGRLTAAAATCVPPPRSLSPNASKPPAVWQGSFPIRGPVPVGEHQVWMFCDRHVVRVTHVSDAECPLCEKPRSLQVIIPQPSGLRGSWATWAGVIVNYRRETIPLLRRRGRSARRRPRRVAVGPVVWSRRRVVGPAARVAARGAAACSGVVWSWSATLERFQERMRR